MHKFVYAQAGKPGESRSRFVENWRDHAGRAMMCKDLFDHVDRYVQSDVLATATAEAGGDASYFGVGELCFRDAGARKACFDAPSRAEKLLPHGQSIFGHPHPMVLACEEHAVLQRRQGIVKVYAFLRRKSTFTLEAFERSWSAAGNGLCALMPLEQGPCSYGRSHPIEGAGDFDGLDELSFDEAALAVRFVRDAYREFIAPLAQPTILLTEQVVLYKRANYS
jgi:hypothetical protein